MKGAKACSVQTLHGWAEVFNPDRAICLQTLLEREFQMALGILAGTRERLLQRPDYISFVSILNYLFKYSGLSLRVISVCCGVL